MNRPYIYYKWVTSAHENEIWNDLKLQSFWKCSDYSCITNPYNYPNRPESMWPVVNTHAHICSRPCRCDSPPSRHTSRTEGCTDCCLHTATGIPCTLLVVTCSSGYKWWDQAFPSSSRLTSKAPVCIITKLYKYSRSKESLPQFLLLLINTDLLHLTPTVVPYLLIWPIFAVVFAITEPLLLQALVTVWASELRRAAWGSCAIHLIRAVAAVSISITSQGLRHTLTASTAVLVDRTGHQTWKEENRNVDIVWFLYSSSFYKH